MAYDAADGTLVLFGGEGRSGSLGDTWTWDGSAWTAGSSVDLATAARRRQDGL